MNTVRFISPKIKTKKWNHPGIVVHTPLLTSCLRYNLQVLGQRSVPDRGEGQHSDVVGLVWRQTLDGDEVGAAHHLLLPLADTKPQNNA